MLASLAGIESEYYYRTSGKNRGTRLVRRLVCIRSKCDTGPVRPLHSDRFDYFRPFTDIPQCPLWTCDLNRIAAGFQVRRESNPLLGKVIGIYINRKLWHVRPFLDLSDLFGDHPNLLPNDMQAPRRPLVI